jgi:hypothetical protein
VKIYVDKFFKIKDFSAEDPEEITEVANAAASIFKLYL